MAKTLRNIVNGDTSRLTIFNDINATNISLVRKSGRHSVKLEPLIRQSQLSEMRNSGLSVLNLKNTLSCFGCYSQRRT